MMEFQIRRMWDRGRDGLRRLFAGESRRQLIVAVGSLIGAGMIGVAIRFVAGIIQGRLVGPEVLGYYSKFTILPGYLFFLHAGVYTSLSRQYPYYLGKGDRDLAVDYASSALGWTWIVCLLHGVIFLVPASVAAWDGDGRAAVGWLTQIVLAVTTIYTCYLACTYRNSSEFVTWSKSTLISSIASAALLPLVIVHQFFGLCVRYGLPPAVGLLYAHWRRPLRVKARLRWDILRKMIVFGAPLMVFNYIAVNLWDSVSRTAILHGSGEKALGVFAFAMLLCQGPKMVATSISQVFNPRLAMRYGSSGKSMSETFSYCMKCTLAGSAVMIPVLALTWWLIGPTVRWLLPKYVDCISVTRLLCWTALVPVVDLSHQLLMVAKRTREIAVSVLVGFGLFAASLGLMLWHHHEVTIEQIAFVSVVGQLIMVSLSIVQAWRLAAMERATEALAAVANAD